MGSAANLFHTCMSAILKPLVKAGIHGIKIKSGGGTICRGHPIFAMYIGDYPEQLLVTCCKNGTCPKCNVPSSELGDVSAPDRPLRDLDKVLTALDEVGNTATAFSKACREAGIKPISHPFWTGLPYVNIFLSITPDILHQIHQGVIKHVLGWLKQAYGAEELDARCRRLPPNHQICLFLRGITMLQRVTGKEHAHMCRFLLGLIVGLPLHSGFSPVRLVRAVRALLDFSYLAQYPAHMSDTLEQLRGALQRFHANKAIFVDLDICDHFHIPKLHSFDHYLNSIKVFGTTDNYDTQYTERLHIDFAKEAYRATNHKDEFPQMTLWLERREKISRHAAYIQWRSDQRDSHNFVSLLTRIQLAKWPTIKVLRFDTAIKNYGVTSLRDAVARFIIKYRSPHLTPHQVEREIRSFIPRFNTLAVFHRVKFILEDAQRLGIMDGIRDVAHARPERKDTHGRKVPARFDTVLVNDGTGESIGVKGYRVGRLRLIFKLPKSACEHHLPNVITPGHLAYVEWFTPFSQPDRIHSMYKVSGSVNARGEPLAEVIEVRNIRRSCHLTPICSTQMPRDWTSSNILDSCKHFWVNPFSDLHMYMTLV
ncbi:hypothetical protein LXA43DRAFT_948029 [Ganoderma leucocontextum]|nr:hypothetical protein LXA43DRAFT_948029 [Ganoderma leucocontextum]